MLLLEDLNITASFDGQLLNLHALTGELAYVSPKSHAPQLVHITSDCQCMPLTHNVSHTAFACWY
jgi:hypothetical protein